MRMDSTTALKMHLLNSSERDDFHITVKPSSAFQAFAFLMSMSFLEAFAFLMSMSFLVD